jgi:hypothetical protein
MLATLTGKQTRFVRTPKVTGRTAAPGNYIVAEYGLFAAPLGMVGAAVLHANWQSASFALTYVALTSYAIVAFIGLPASAEDLRLWLRPPGAPPQPRPWEELSGAAAATPTSCRISREVQRQDP